MRSMLSVLLRLAVVAPVLSASIVSAAPADSPLAATTKHGNFAPEP